MAPTLIQSLSTAFLLFSPAAFGLVVSNTLPSPWVSKGCYTDNVSNRALQASEWTSTTAMTEEACIGYCQNLGWAYAGVEYSQECYCGNSIVGGSTVATATDCNMACTGNANEQCGGPNRLNVFFNSAQSIPAAPVHNPGVNGYTEIGCYTDAASRTLGVGMAVPGGASAMTVELCTAACGASGYKYAGVEYASQCFCGNSFTNGGGPYSNGYTNCNMLCSGNQTEYCGGPNALDMYQFGVAPPPVVTTTSTTSTRSTTSTTTTSTTPTTTSRSTTTTTTTHSTTSTTTTSSTPTTTSRSTTTTTTTPTTTSTTSSTRSTTSTTTTTTTPTSTSRSTTTTTTTSTTPTTTSTTSSTRSTTSTTTTTTTPTTTSTTTTSTTTTSTTPTTTSTTTSSTTSTTTTSTTLTTTSMTSTRTTSTTTAATTYPTSAATNLPAGWHYQGCWNDNVNGRIMLNEQPDNSAMTVESCIATCISLGYPVAGMEYAQQCFCDVHLIAGATLASADSNCNMACTGSSAEMCGAGNLMSVYASVPLTVLPVPVVQTTGLPGNWQYQACITEAVGFKLFPQQIVSLTNMSAELCLSACAAYGYGAAGMEYGQECYCGDFSDIAAGGSTVQPASACNMPCTGAPQYLCGAGNLLSYYQWQGSLNTWHYPQGNAAGSYSLLIGGVVVPLITTAGVNGKYTFVEKWGTGPPNSTGAYELDVANLNNFNAAWRTMHVKTDVFCSAGLTLPDKAGRQINIGGWSGQSTFGVRLYWPDGSPGVASVNDWQENEQEVSLLTGRWYPSAMIMSNGSILVVGGENGSNGPPVPNMEILPATGGGLVPAPWLAETDPFSLYPFLAVMPSGYIFMGYYNQALLLDPVSLSPYLQLPAIPGAVNNPAAGRTYPLEGTMVMQPIHLTNSAPYITQPVTVMICGGSTSGPGDAVDNCVSMQPDVPGSQWVIERMPSKRVMSCICSLPDGTFIIMNGAEQGVAGFDLATLPNQNAIMYDPSQPVQSRFSVMANTSVARLYHSEAILMQDGRCMVSGSDPEDGVNPQEYRVEVFSPPYALNGLAKPTFTITNKSWSYGQQVTMTVNLPNGGTSTMKISMVGAESSTHGNSMGQRVLFPTFTAAGNTVVVTAPPNNKICPPGWFQLFVLDNGTPSMSTWIRVGGDPASLGNWPNYPDFTIPGV